MVHVDLHGGAVHQHAQLAQRRKRKHTLGAAGGGRLVRKRHSQQPIAGREGKLELPVQSHLEVALDAQKLDVGVVVGEDRTHGGVHGLGKAAKAVYLSNRPLAEKPIRTHRDLARHGETVAPGKTVRRGGVLRVWHAHPANEDAAALLVLEDLRCVEVKAPVKLDEARLVHLRGCKDAPRQREVSGLVEVLPARGLAGQALRTNHEVVMAVHLDDVGALPHVAKGVRGLDAPAVRPRHGIG